MYDAICPISMSKSVEIGDFCAISVEIEEMCQFCGKRPISIAKSVEIEGFCAISVEIEEMCQFCGKRPISIAKSVEIGGFCAKTPVTALNDRKCDQNVVYAVLSRFLSQNPDFDT
ncbi:hypothetical protein AZ09_13995 [Acetobacter aceti 1023]|nr:hypothetical protein AZ09_13995 [Acetobacter aceti 1023]